MSHKAARREKKRAKQQRRTQDDAQIAASPSPSAEATSDVDVDLTELASPIAEPPPFQPATRTQSGYAPRMPDTPRVDDDTLSDHLVNLQPLYREVDGKGERAAELEVEDLSLRIDGSFLSSPLTSMPPLSVRTLAAQIARAVGLVLLATSSGYGVWSAVRDLRSSAAPEIARAEVIEARPATAPLVAASLPASAQAAGEAQRDDAVPAAAPASTKLPRARVLRGSVDVPPVAPPVAPTTQPTDEASAPSTAAPIGTEAATDTTLAPTAPLPKRPSPTAVRASFGQIRDELSACTGGRKGIVTMRVVIAGSGRVTSGTVDGGFQSPEERTCMARTILGLRFPPFQQAVFEITYPLAL